MTNPILVHGHRGDMVESFFRGAFTTCTPQGQVILSEGDCHRLIYPRSSLKPLQALGLHLCGAYDFYGLSPQHIALACSSHNGEPEHLHLIEQWLHSLGLTANDLECSPHYPLGTEAARHLKENQISPTPLHNTCSGKHAGFLTIARFLNHPIRGYTRKDHPTQQFINRTISEICAYDVSKSPQGIDGCQAPVVSMSLQTLATAMAKLTQPDQLPISLAKAAFCVVSSFQAHPFFVGGTGRFCTDVARETNGDVLVKMGADGVFSAFIPREKIGIALKIDDGHMRAAEVAMIMVLERLAVNIPSVLFNYKEQPILNWGKKTVGKYVQALYSCDQNKILS